jgi:hypothetical protein
MSTRRVLVISGPPQLQPHLMNYAIASFTILALVISITESSPSSRLIFHPTALATEVCQPDDNNASFQLVVQYMSGKGFDFMTSTIKGTL